MYMIYLGEHDTVKGLSEYIVTNTVTSPPHMLPKVFKLILADRLH